MLLSISHETLYRFSNPARYTIQHLHLTPHSDASQQVRHWVLEAPGDLAQQVDAFGNLQHTLVRTDVHEDVRIAVKGEVESIDTVGVLEHHPAESRLPKEIYLRPTALTDPDETVAEFAAPLREAFEADTLDGLHKLSRAVAEAVSYRKGMTDVESPASHVLRSGVGVCQDQAHVFIAAARLLGAPTRYVSGYVHVVGDDADESASHAWAESWVDGLGWVSFDVTNEICPADAHVRLAVGPDYLACAPIRGMRRGGGIEEMIIQVSVAAVQQ